ncbi:LuxR C-terminal-related transcriptional regulator [Cohnella cholangitidis]|uniref:LuxR family transcriptional regulator n=1 Tax=Cohnella cholangitidis TaxID=2598458 RepID=A0A7G5BW20_9BACL|nr:LuxR C-terminal-related transcriptional regulator [Cohnella cholangitidis]QMV41154.1 LuxR family transcriptional regulator [Cohnella cholangitidis]
MNSSSEPILLHTKTSHPVSRKNLVQRQRLVQLIEQGIEGRLTVVSAPAGFGKTTLLSQWVRQTGHAVAWVALDEMDNDPVRFWRYVAEALASSFPRADGNPYEQLLRTMPSLSMSTFLDAFIHRLHTVPHPMVLALDDYHVIKEPRIHDSIAYFIEHAPKPIHILLSSRNDLPFPSVKWKVLGELNAIDAAHLKFTVEESESFYREVAGIPLSSQQIEKLNLQTEGWATGLQLVSISLRTDDDYDRFIEQFKGYHRDVADYLFHEVIAKLPADIQDFLLRTSVFERLDAKACDAVTHLLNGGQMLEKLKAMNLFLVSLDDHDAWFRYHHLFAEFLRNRVRKNDPELWIRTNLDASKSLSARGLMDEAIDHAIAAEQYELTESLLTRHASHVLKRGEFPTLLHWLDSFPEESGLSPEMLLLYAFLLVVTGQPERANRQLVRLDSSLLGMEPGEARQQLQSGLLFVKSNLLFTNGDFAQWLTFISGILDDILPHNPIFYNFNYNMTEPLVRRSSFGLKGVLTAETEKIGMLFAEVLEKHGWGDSLINLYVVQSLAEGFYEWNRLEESQALLNKVERAARLKAVPGLFVPNRITQAKLYGVRDQFDLALETLDEALQFAAKLPESHWASCLLAAKLELLVRMARLPAAKREAGKLDIRAKDKPTFNREFEFIALAKLLGAQNKEKEALRLLELLKPQARREGSLMGLAEISINQALLLDQLGQRSNAFHCLQEALALGEANGYIRSFVDVGAPMQKLLLKYVSSSPESETARSETYVRMLLDTFPKPESGKPEGSGELPSLVEPLTRAEIHLLSLIRQGASNKLIAEKLVLSEGSVKVYASRIYGKLGVSSRTQAVIAAQRLGLLPGE